MNSGCLGFGEAGGMGEGWGDAFATLIRQIEEHKNFGWVTDFVGRMHLTFLAMIPRSLAWALGRPIETVVLDTTSTRPIRQSTHLHTRHLTR